MPCWVSPRPEVLSSVISKECCWTPLPQTPCTHRRERFSYSRSDNANPGNLVWCVACHWSTSTLSLYNMLAGKRTQSDAGLSDDGPASKRASNVLGYNARTPWLHESKVSASRRSIGNRAHAPSLALSNMVSAVQDLLDPDFDPLIAILDEEPRFLKPLPTRISTEDLEFLRFRGALAIPENGLRTELLRCYIKWVHSFLPVLDLQEFLRCIAQNDSDGNISLLLFQAVMFAATAFVDLKHLQAAGYTTRKSARNAFYNKLRLLHSLDCEDDRIVIVQTLLLMTYWSDHNSPQRDIWDWIGICNVNAHSIGLNRDPSSSDMDIRTKRLRTRIWWCLFSRDRLIAMGMRRPTQVNEGSSNLPMLRLEDFNFEPFHPAVIEQFHCRQLEDVSHQKRLATMFIEKAKLCQCIGRVLFAQYTPSQYQFGLTNRTTINLVPRHASESELARCSQRLESWLAALPKDAQFIPASRTNFNEGEDVLLIHGAMIRMLYHATVSALHRPWAYGSTNDQTKSRLELAKAARTKMQEAAISITQIVQGLNQLDLTRYLPQSGVTVILPAAVAHLANSTSNDPAVRKNSISNFQRCIQVLQGLKEIYPAADQEVANIEAAVKAQSSSTNALLRIMQFNASPQPREIPYQTNSVSKPSQELPGPLEVESNQWTPPTDQPDPIHPILHELGHSPTDTSASPPNYARKDSTAKGTHINRQQNQPTPPEDFTESPNNNQAHRDHPSSSTPLIFTDLKYDVETYTSNFTPTDPNQSNGPDIDFDWTSELLRWADANPEYYSGTAENEPRDIFSFPTGPDHSPTSSHGHLNGGITGDLDRDLGLICSGDEMF
ncbi:fungal-specific transcription factor domain-containing protein [Aspergillus egyptiacus]|nr:fungal-specific transcription factor domain-containing protein [Aspergillus egyptiacus]